MEQDAGVVSVANGESSVGSSVDKIGGVCSAVCAAHCASSALLPGALAALGLGALVNPTLEWGLSALAVALGSTAAVMAWRQQRPLWVLLLLITGVAGIASGRLLESSGVHGLGVFLSIGAGLLLAAGHFANRRAAR